MDGICSTVQTESGWLKSLSTYRSNPVIFFMAVLIVILNLTDAVCTQFIIDHGGWEVNPIARAAMAAFGEYFWLWKHGVVSLSVIALSSYIHLRMARVCLAVAACTYCAVTVWHLILIDSLCPLM